MKKRRAVCAVVAVSDLLPAVGALNVHAGWGSRLGVLHRPFGTMRDRRAQWFPLNTCIALRAMQQP
jgi:hypothetical protein